MSVVKMSDGSISRTWNDVDVSMNEQKISEKRVSEEGEGEEGDVLFLFGYVLFLPSTIIKGLCLRLSCHQLSRKPHLHFSEDEISRDLTCDGVVLPGEG